MQHTLMHVSLITADHIGRRGAGGGEPFGRLARRAAGGAAWVLLAFAVAKVLGFGTNIVLARLLTPADFGLVSFAMILIGAFLLLQDLGVGPALVYSRRDSVAAGGTALAINLAVATGLFAITLLGAAVATAAGASETTAAIVVALSFGLVITAAGSVQATLLTKELAFRKKVIPDVAPLIVSGLVSIGLALAGWGVWSLVAGYLAKNLATTVLLWALSPVRPRPRFDPAIARELLGYGGHISLSAVVGFAVMNVDYFIVGRVLGAGALGLYTLAFMIGSLPSTLIGQQIATAVFPAYARIRQSPAALQRLFAGAFAGSTALSVALGAAVFVGAPAIVGPVLGAKWLGIAGPLRLLAVFGTLRAIEFTFSPLYRAIGRPEIMWASGLVRLVVLAPLIYVATAYGIGGVAIVQAAVGAVFIAANGAILARLIALTPGTVARLAVPQVVGVTAMVGVVAAAYGNPATAAAVHRPAGAAALAAAAIVVQLAIVAGLSPQLVGMVRRRAW